MESYDVVIVGSGHGGAQTAIGLRQGEFGGSVALISKDTQLPYERPPLSKEYLARKKTFDRFLTRRESFWKEKNIDLILRTEVTAVDPEQRLVILSDGRSIGYGELVWAAGGEPRRLICRGSGIHGVFSIRTKEDVDQIIEALDAGARRVVIVGGGYIGLEAAAALTEAGCDVVLLETLERVLSRVAGEQVSRFFEREHRARSVDIRLAASVECIEGRNGRASAVRLVNGDIIPCDFVIVGIGIVPSIEPLTKAGAAVSNGVEVDASCRTSLPHIYAIGDCAAHLNSYADGARIRIESVQNASDMAMTAVKAICGQPSSYHATPWFWSNQYDIKLLTVGLSHGHDVTVVRGDPESRSFSVIYLRAGRVVALDCINSMKDYVQGRKLVDAAVHARPHDLANVALPLKSLVSNTAQAS